MSNGPELSFSVSELSLESIATIRKNLDALRLGLPPNILTIF